MMKLRRMILIIIFSQLLVGSVVSAQTTNGDYLILTTVSNVLSGGQYVLTIQPTAATQPTGYRLLDAVTIIDPAPGCCCKSYMPCVRK
jgi:hypothetical protein